VGRLDVLAGAGVLLEHAADLGDLLETAAAGALVETELERDLGGGQERELLGEVRSQRVGCACTRCHVDIVRQGCDRDTGGAPGGDLAPGRY